MYYTTLNRIRAYSPCIAGWKKLLWYLGKTQADDEPLSLLTILESNGIADAIWALRAIDYCPEIRLYAVRCIRQIQHILCNPVLLDILDTAELFAVGAATADELSAAQAAARDVVRAAAQAAARDVVRVAARAAVAAQAAAEAVVRDAEWIAARAAAQAAARDAAEAAARDNVRAVAWDAAWDAARSAQHDDFIDIFCQFD